jgi:hypothetical protein
MSKDEIDKFWASAEKTAAYVDTWPVWKQGYNKDDERFKSWPRCESCEWPVKTPVKIGKYAVCNECRPSAYQAYVEDLEAKIKTLEDKS